MKNLKDFLIVARQNAEEEKSHWQFTLISGVFAVVILALVLSGQIPVLSRLTPGQLIFVIFFISLFLFGLGYIFSLILPIGKIKLSHIKKWCNIIFLYEEARLKEKLEQISEELKEVCEDRVEGERILLSEKEDLIVLQECNNLLGGVCADKLRSTVKSLAVLRDLGEDGSYLSEESDLIEEIKESIEILNSLSDRIQNLKKEFVEVEQNLKSFQNIVRPYLRL